ncbi:phosphoglycolate phosphatase [Candidatus Endobugula sertula]|uniref:Phosphoglycolate phosphatase n=1 Tax=Candidatus Endobugula sertula TaxID=62101 RepID=A0A1D2QM42_9GAMM|nr:phosphoglycolate phosphatase [Candidatus Endobugula sertula]
MKQMIKAVFFDLDGTLLDSAPDFYVAMHQLMDEYQQPRLKESDIRAFISHGARALITLAFGLSKGDEGFEVRHQRLLNIYHDTMGNHCSLFPGMEQLLKHIKQHHLFWGVITNKPARFTDPIMASLPLPSHPNLVICPDHTNNTKPDPEPLLLACNKVACKPVEAIYIGDHRRDIECGIAAGSLTIATRYGYLDKTDPIESWNAHFIAGNCDNIWPYIENKIKEN